MTLQSLAGAKVLDLITVGRVSGQPREIEIWFVEHAGKLYLFAEMGERAGWVRNLKRNPSIRVNLAGKWFAGTARIVDTTAEPALCQALRAIENAKYEWDGGLPIELTLRPETGGP